MAETIAGRVPRKVVFHRGTLRQTTSFYIYDGTDTHTSMLVISYSASGDGAAEQSGKFSVKLSSCNIAVSVDFTLKLKIKVAISWSRFIQVLPFHSEPTSKITQLCYYLASPPIQWVQGQTRRLWPWSTLAAARDAAKYLSPSTWVTYSTKSFFRPWPSHYKTGFYLQTQTHTHTKTALCICTGCERLSRQVPGIWLSPDKSPRHTHTHTHM